MEAPGLGSRRRRRDRRAASAVSEPAPRPPAKPAFTVFGRIKSFRHAFAGLGFMLRTQHNAWLHLAASIIVIAAGIVLKIGSSDWRWLVVALVLVWVAEAVNTAFEHLCDVVAPQFHDSVKLTKDIAAGAVLITA